MNRFFEGWFRGGNHYLEETNKALTAFFENNDQETLSLRIEKLHKYYDTMTEKLQMQREVLKDINDRIASEMNFT